MKIWKIAGIALVVVLGASVVTGSIAFAQNEDPGPGTGTEQVAPSGPQNRGPAFDRPRGGGMDEITLEYVADALGLSADELQARLDAGERLPDIADELGVEKDVLDEAFKAARIAHIEQAVADGALTQEEADAILERMEQAEQVAEALEAMRNAEIEEALAEGVITEEQAELLQDMGGKGFGFGGPRGPQMAPGMGGRGGFAHGQMRPGGPMFQGPCAPNPAPGQ